MIMDETGTFDTISEYTSDARVNISYEVLLGRQYDRCLFYRTTSSHGTFPRAVRALDLALVDIEGKPLRSEFDSLVQKYPLYLSRDIDYFPAEKQVEYDEVFKLIGGILGKYHLLFRSTLLEVNR